MPKYSYSKGQSPRKPEMERKRRQRINICLSQIKQLIPEAKELEIKKGCRLEKAEILEITVEFIRKMQQMNKKLAADKMMQEARMETITEPPVGHEAHPPFFNASSVPPGPVFPGHFDLPQDYDTAPLLYTTHIPPNRVYPPLFRPSPRFFTPLCVSSNTIYNPTRGESFAFQQSVERALLKETERTLDDA